MRRIHISRLPSPKLLPLQIARAPALFDFGNGALFGVVLGDAGEGFAAVLLVDDGGGEFEGGVVVEAGAAGGGGLGGVVGCWFVGWGGGLGWGGGVEVVGEVGCEGAVGAGREC